MYLHVMCGYNIQTHLLLLSTEGAPFFWIHMTKLCLLKCRISLKTDRDGTNGEETRGKLREGGQLEERGESKVKQIEDNKEK